MNLNIIIYFLGIFITVPCLGHHYNNTIIIMLLFG